MIRGEADVIDRPRREGGVAEAGQIGREHAVPSRLAEGRLDEVAVPTLVVVAAEDVADIVSMAERLAGAIPGARLETIAGAGHLPSLERPNELNRLLLDFLR